MSTTKFDCISEITAEKESWNIMAKVIRLWVVSDLNGKSKLPFSMELVLLDNKGDRIHASIRKSLIYKFEKLLNEGLIYSFQKFGVASIGGSYRSTQHMYKLNFSFTTKVDILPNVVIDANVYNFIPISEISLGCHDPDYLVDVIGCMTAVGTEREYERNGKRIKLNVIALEADGHRVECTLFGSYVDELNLFLAAGEHNNVVVIVQLAKVKQFQEKMTMQNCIDCTKVFFNPVCEEAVQVRQRMMLNNQESPTEGLSQINEPLTVGAADDFLINTARKTIESLKDCTEQGNYVVCATIKHIIDDDWWYTACVCNKSVYPDSKMFFCEKCNKHVIKVTPRYRIKVRVIDSTDSATFVIFDRDASTLFNKSCADMFDMNDKTIEGGAFPREIAELVDETFLFKVEYKKASSSKFEQTFSVKKICNDQSIINKFNEVDVTEASGSLHLGNQNSSMIQAAAVDLAEDLMPKFSAADAVVDLEAAPMVGPEVEAPLKWMKLKKKKIKKEKI